MFGKDRYSRGAHTVLELKYHFVWKTKYSYPVLRNEIGLRLSACKEISESKGNNPARYKNAGKESAICA
jgi:REP element-mobilizing transposase RayT